MQNKWMTRAEFESDAICQYCWIVYSSEKTGDLVLLVYYTDGKYYEHTFSVAYHDIGSIKAVMPIDKPEYPKEVV